MVLPFRRRRSGVAEDEFRPEEGQDRAGVAELGAHDARADGFLGLVGEHDKVEEVVPGPGFHDDLRDVAVGPEHRLDLPEFRRGGHLVRVQRREDLDPLALDERRMVPVTRLHVHDIDVPRYRPDDPGPEVRVADKPPPLLPAPERGNQGDDGLLPDRTDLVQQVPLHPVEPDLDERRTVRRHLVDDAGILHRDDDLHTYRRYTHPIT